MKKAFSLFIILSLLALTGCQTTTSGAAGSAAVSASSTMPAHFIAQQLDPATCTAHASNFAAKLQNVRDLAAQDDSLLEADSSLTVSHDYISLRWRDLLAISYAAAATNNSAQASQILDTLVYLADRRTLLASRKLSDARGQKCWAEGNSDAPCAYHTTQHVSIAFVAMMISAIVLEEHMTDAQRAALTPYFDSAYRSFVGPLASDQLNGKGIYELADFGIGELAYARWTGDAQRAQREINRRIRSFQTLIEPSGYIDNNSYRGYRGYWYHTHGNENVFGYALIARAFGVDMFNDPRLSDRFRALAQRTAQGGTDYQSFLGLPQRGDNAYARKEDEIPHMHQMAINLPTVLAREYGITPRVAPGYTSKGRFETINRLVLYNAACYYGSN